MLNAQMAGVSAYPAYQSKGLTMKNDTRDNGVLDAILAIVIAAAGLILALAYFDVLVK
jgi:hypothetical protein